ncbi:MAG: tetratricopeptide repeat protein [Planctomycetes bacterium]|nr:tetratricopeptide repeat protein [Planctomycetota bacterium]
MSSSTHDCWQDRVRHAMREYEHLQTPSRYTLLEELGRGGMGIVYRARDTRLQRDVALKLLRDDALIEPEDRARFRREALAMARLSHPNVVAVHDVGEQGARPYLVMELVEGRPLTDVLKNPPAVDPLLALMEKVARAVHHAHERGIIHRDLKPSNILVTPSGEPKVADFGIARLAGPQATLTHSGTLRGTPADMAREQIRARGEALTPQTDVYALGAILYEILTGRPPFDAPTLPELFQRILADDPAPPGRAPQAICIKALEKDPRRRYETARDFADDLRRHLDGEPVLAKPPSRVVRLGHKLLKHRAMVAPLAAAILVVLAVSVAGAIRKAERIRNSTLAAARYEKEGNLTEARDAWKSVLDLDGEHAQARASFDRADREIKNREEAYRLLEVARPALDQAVLYLYTEELDYAELVKRVDQAQATIKKAIEKAPTLAVAHHLQGRAWEIRGDHDQAQASWRKAIEVNPSFGPARHRLGRSLVLQALITSAGNSDERQQAGRRNAQPVMIEAMAELEKAQAEGSGFDDLLQREFAAALLAGFREDVDSGRRIIRAALEQFKGRMGVEDLHWLDGLLGPAEKALAAYDRAIAISPNCLMALFLRGNQRLRVADLDGAIADFTRALRVNPSFASLYLNRSIARYRKGDHDGAIADSEAGLKIAPRAAALYIARAQARLAKAEWEGVISDCTEALAIDPSSATAYDNRGFARYAVGNLDGAIADFSEAIKIDPQDDEAYVNRATAWIQKGEFQRASADCDAALGIDARCLEAFVNRASARAEMGDLDGAIADCTAALALQAGCKEALSLRARCRSRMGDVDGALADYDRALELAPRDPLIHYNRAVVREQKGDLRGAAADYKKALQLAPPDWTHRKAAEEALRGMSGSR